MHKIFSNNTLGNIFFTPNTGKLCMPFPLLRASEDIVS